MIGLGIWEIPVNSMFFKGTAIITVKEESGKYKFKFESNDITVPKIEVLSVSTKGQTMHAQATSPILKGKTLNAEITFNGNECNGVVSGPLGVKIKIAGKKIG